MKIIKIFTEGGSRIGYGHLNRCKALYNEAVKQGHNVSMILHGDIDEHTVKEMNVEFAQWYSKSFLSENISSEEYCIVDSYLLDIEGYETVAQLSKEVLFMDDTYRLKYPKGIVLNSCLYVDVNKYDTRYIKDYLLGPKYVILRNAFNHIENKSRSNRVMVTIGGSDPLNITPDIISVLRKKNFELDVIIGPGFTNVNYEDDHQVTYYRNVTAEVMRDIMLTCQYCITAAGQTIYELLRTNTPFIAIQVADNQLNNIIGLNNVIDEVVTLDARSEDWQEQLVHSLDCVNKMNLSTIVDSDGAKRIIEKLTR